MPYTPNQPPAQKTDRQKEQGNNLVFSYMALRNLIGFSGMLLPVVLVVFTKESNNKNIENSISDYYYTSNGDMLVVLLSVLGVFLFTYRGYKLKEKLLLALAAICAIGIAFSPTATNIVITNEFFSVHTPNQEVAQFLGLEQHLIFAGTFFIAIALLSLFYFPKKSPGTVLKKPDGNMTQKAKRNVVYKICGWIMLASVLVLVLYFLVTPFKKALGDFPMVFVMETVAIEAFGISWITKGETLWPDGEHYMKRAWQEATNS